MKYIIILFSIFIYYTSIGQNNLVLNPSFEIYTSLPAYLYASDGGINYCEYWSIPTQCSVDYYNEDNDFEPYKAFNNSVGKHYPHSGTAYIGIIPIYWSGYMEHITGSLKEPLQKGKRYKVDFYIKYASDSSYLICSNIGVYFSKEKYPFRSGNPFYNKIITPDIKAHVQSKTNEFLSDTSWTLISGYYIAKGGERYLTLGMFYNENILTNSIDRFVNYNIDWFNRKRTLRFLKNKYHQRMLKVNPNFKGEINTNTECPYYLIDDVSVVPVDDEGNEIILYPELIKDETETKVNELINIDSVEEGGSITLKNIFFQTSKSELLSASFKELNILVDIMQKNEQIEIEISGHTDNTGTEKYNQKLSEARAKTVADYLISNGIESKRIVYKGYGNSKSITSNETEEGRSKNRRVEIKILKK